MLLQGKNTVIYGDVRFGNNVLLEDNVVIGHPSAAEMQGCSLDLQEYTTIEQLYMSKSKAPVTIGDNAVIRSGTVIYSGVTIGDNFDCSHNVLIREDCTIGEYVYIKANTVIMKQVQIGNDCRLGGVIGDFSIIGNHISSLGSLTHRYGHHFSHVEPGPILHDGCIVGRDATVIGNVHIYENAIVAASAVANFDVPAGSLVIGPKGTIRTNKYPLPDPPVVQPGLLPGPFPVEG